MKLSIMAGLAAAVLFAPAAFAQDAQASDDLQPGDRALYCIALYDYFNAQATEAPADWVVQARRHAVEEYTAAVGVTAAQADKDSQAMQAVDGFKDDEVIMELDVLDCDDVYNYDD